VHKVHELSAAQAIVDFLQRENSRRGRCRIRAVGLRIGELTDLVPEALQFGFEVITRGGPFDGVRLEIEAVPLEARCSACARSFGINDYIFACPDCGSGKIEILKGQEMDIGYIEIDDSVGGSPATTS